MGTERSDMVYGYWRDASEKFDYFVAGITIALVGYLGEKIGPVRVAWSAEAFEAISVAVLLASLVAGLKRIEAWVTFLGGMHRQIYHQEATGSLVGAAMKSGLLINQSTGEIFTWLDAVKRAGTHKSASESLQKPLVNLIKDAERWYKWRNRLLLLGLALMLVARAFPA